MAEVGRAVYDLLGPRTRGVDIVILDYVIDVLKVGHTGCMLTQCFPPPFLLSFWSVVNFD